MKHALILAAGLLTLAACGDGPTEGDTAETEAASTLRADCETIANDPEGQENITEMGTDTDGFCDCAMAYIDELSEEEQAQAEATMKVVAEGMNESGEGAEEVVGEMMGDAMANPDDADMQANSAGIRLVGQMIDDIGDGFEDTGACPAG